MLEKFPREKPDFSKLAAKVAQSGAQAVMFIGSAGNVSGGVKVLRAAGSRAQVVTLSNNASEGFIKLLGEHARGVIVTQVFSPTNARLPTRSSRKRRKWPRSRGWMAFPPP